MTDPWRCPDCGTLALPHCRTHRRGCAYGVTSPDVLASIAAAREEAS